MLHLTQKEENYAIPVDAPAYGPQPTIYKNVVFNYVYYLTDPAKIAPLLPEPFTPGDDGLCVAFAIDVPFSSCYGPFQEMGLVVQAKWKGENCFYQPALYLNNDSAIAAGREIYGSPKKYAQMNFSNNQCETFSASATRGGVEFLKITTKILGTGENSDFPSIFPYYNLKMIPSIEGPWPEVKQITSCCSTDVETHSLFRCAGTVQLTPCCTSGIWTLQPKEILGASRACRSYVDGWGTIAYDYLHPERNQ